MQGAAKLPGACGELEEIDLERVDKEIEDQEKAAGEKYNNFDLQEGWKVGTDLPEGCKTISDLHKDWKLGKEMKEPVTSNKKDGKQDQHVIPDEGLSYTQRMEKKMDQLRRK